LAQKISIWMSDLIVLG